MFGKKKQDNKKKDDIVVVSTHNKNVELKIEEQLAKQKKIVVADNLMLVLWIATIVLFATHLYFYGFVTFGCLAFCTFNTSTAKKLRNEYALLAVCIMSFVCVPFILAIDIFKLARINSKVKALEKEKLPETKVEANDNVDDESVDGVTDATTEDNASTDATDATGDSGNADNAVVYHEPQDIDDIELDLSDL